MINQNDSTINFDISNINNDDIMCVYMHVVVLRRWNQDSNLAMFVRSYRFLFGWLDAWRKLSAYLTNGSTHSQLVVSSMTCDEGPYDHGETNPCRTTWRLSAQECGVAENHMMQIISFPIQLASSSYVRMAASKFLSWKSCPCFHCSNSLRLVVTSCYITSIRILMCDHAW